MEQYYHRPFADFDERRIRRLLLLESDPQDLPKEVIESYWRYKILHDKIGGQISADGIIRILEWSKIDIPMPLPPSFAKELQDGLHPAGTLMEVRWRSGNYAECTFISADKREVVFEMEGERKSAPINRDMRIAKQKELELAEETS